MTTLNATLENLKIGNVKLVTINQLENILSDVVLATDKNSMFASVIQLTEPKCLVKDRQTKEPFNGKIKKLSKVSIILNRDYVAQVTTQLNREDKPETDYKKGQNTMPIDKCENNNFFGYFNGKAVIEYRPNDNSTPTVKYFLNDEIIDKNDLPDVLPISYPAKNQGTEREILWRKLYLSNVVQLTINGQTYQLIR